MSAATLTSEPRRSSFARVPAAFRLQFTVPANLVWVPLLVFFVAWAFGIGTLALIASQLPDRGGEPLSAVGAAQATLWCLLFMAAYAASHTFPFSMALSYSRRTYVIGAFLAFALVSAAFGLAVSLGAGVERLTNGFGAELYVFDAPVLTESSGIAGAGVFAAVICLFAMLFGFFWAILYRRVSVTVLWGVILAVAVVLLGAIALITRADAWMNIWTWLMEQTTLTLSAWALLAIVIMGVINYVLIRKATAG